MIGRVAVLGYGEVGQILAQDLAARGAQVTAYDVLFSDPESAPAKAAASGPVRAAASAHEAVRDAELVIASVTAERTAEAAASVEGALPAGAFYLDINSASPGVKAGCARRIDASGGRYVEAAVMTAVPPHRIASPMLLGGPHAEDFLKAVEGFGFSARVYSTEVGKASAVKMCRSVMIKGMEALITESMLTARALGVEKDVLASLGETLPVPDWEAFARYMMSRSLLHGRRRAEEMREVARTVAEAGVSPLMSDAIAKRQDVAAELGAGADLDVGFEAMVDAVLVRAGLKA